MAHYAFLDENYVVTEVIVGKDESNYDWEAHYGQFRGQLCKRTSYNTHGGVHNSGGTPYRKNYAGIGYSYDPQRDAFIPPKPFASWQLNETTVRGYLTGSSWRTYKNGSRSICGVPIPDGMREHERFPEPIVTPTTKAKEGHDEDISREEIIRQGLVSEEDYDLLEKYTIQLFKRGAEIAAKMGLILVDTKYEFGKKDGQIYLIDEIHTPDSSRYFYAEGYEDRFAKGEPQKQLSKEFVREWLMENGFQGKEGQKVPEMSDAFVNSVSERYIELYEGITGEKFVRADASEVLRRVENNILNFLK